MQMIITGKNMQVTDWLESYVQKKIGKLNRYLNDPAEAHVELSEESTRDARQRQVVQVTIYKNGTVLRGEERSSDMSAAVDAVAEKLERQIERFKNKKAAKKKHAQADGKIAEPAEESPTQIIRVKRFRVSPISEDEAIEQMELLGHSFYLFQNDTTSELNVVYKREDGSYGLLQPELAKSSA